MKIDFTKATKRNLYRRQLEKEVNELIDPATGMVSEKVSNYISCPLCGEDEKQFNIFTVNGYPHVRCEVCGLVFTNPQVDEKKLHQLYGESKANELWLDVITSETESKERYKLYDRYFDELEKLTSNRSLVDVGCSIGDLLLAAKNRGWDGMGFDLGRKAIDFAKNKRGLNAHCSRIEDFGFKKSSIPVITMTGVLEHMNDPLQILNKMHSLLIPGGLLLIQVPNLNSLHNMILHEKSPTFDGRNHLIFFTIKTLRDMLEKAKFSIKLMSTYQAVTHLVARHLQFYNLYEGPADYQFLPNRLSETFKDEKQHDGLSRWLEEMEMGRSILAIASKG